MMRLRGMLLVIVALGTPVAWGQPRGSVAHIQRNFDTESSKTKPNKLPEIHGLTAAGLVASPVRGLNENPQQALKKELQPFLAQW